MAGPPDILVDLRWVRGEGLDGISRYALEIAGRLPALLPELRVGFLDAERGIRERVARAPGSPEPAWVEVPFAVATGHDLWSLPAFLRAQACGTYYTFNYITSPRHRGYRVVLTMHDTVPLDFPELLEGASRAFRLYHRVPGLLARVLARADRIVTVSEASRRAIAGRFPEAAARVRVVLQGANLTAPPGGDGLAARARYGLPDRYVLYVGRLDPHKNLPYLVSEFAATSALRASGAALAIAGPRDERYLPKLRERAERAGAADRVRFVGYVTEGDLGAVYAGALALVMPSLAEGFGRPVLEAMACGTPVLSSARSSLPEVGGEAALYFDPESPGALAALLDRVAGDPVLRDQLAVAGRARAARFTWERCAAEIAEILRGPSLGRLGKVAVD